MKQGFKEVPGGITAPTGFLAAAVSAGIRRRSNDLALLVSDPPAAAAGVFTTNRIQAAPVQYCRQALERASPVNAVLINSGNANACTGSEGMRAVETMAAAMAAELKCSPGRVLVASTGTIGVPLPIDKITAAIPKLPAGLSRAGGVAAGRAILTTDTVEKTVALTAAIEGLPVTVGGMAKGAGMIEPHMATMLAFVSTDAAVTPAALRAAVRQAADVSFNRIMVDGDQSTNDTLLLLANGCAGNRPLAPGAPGWDIFEEMLNTVCRRLACAVVADGEGATKLVTVTVKGASDAAGAEKAARAVGRSLLVKTAWNGADPNWGRVMAALGYSGADVLPERVAVDFDDVPAVRTGIAAGTPLSDLRRVLDKPAFELRIDLGLGAAEYTIWSCDCSAEYVRINAAYMT